MNVDFWKNKKVFLTGHTGFKGSWMSLWLIKAGAQVTGYSKDFPTTPSLFQDLKIDSDMNSILADIRDQETLEKCLLEARPDIVIHMAAQPLVRSSYQIPVETFMTNVMGTVHLFEAVRKSTTAKICVNVTSDKCYENRERLEGYKEDEAMGGYDPYSSSKGCAELVTSAYRRSFFQKEGKLLASGRAGNVIGGGDWALDRIVPDAIRAVLENKELVIRNPEATRPWQHVLEPVGGYLLLAEKLFNEGAHYSEGFNFGPAHTDHCSVGLLLEKLNQQWDNRLKIQVQRDPNQVHEAHYLSLDCSKANSKLQWQPRWNVDQALQKTVEWVQAYEQSKSIRETCLMQMSSYESFS